MWTHEHSGNDYRVLNRTLLLQEIKKNANKSLMIACLLAVGEVSGRHRIILETLKFYLLLLCLSHDINSEKRGNVLALMRNSLPCAVRTEGRAVKGFGIC